jgi:thioredoxin-dependent peroxiredoxin
MNQLKEGDKAPDFKAIDQFGKEVSLKKLAGSKIILYFYPKDSTPGCTAEACNLRDNYDELIKKGFKIIGVSADSDVSHKKFMNKYSLPFSLIPDTDKEILNAYGVWGEKKFMGRNFMGIIRTTFIISEKGIIEKIITKVDTKNHTEQIYKTINI